MALVEQPTSANIGCVMAFDFGEKRIGVAMGEQLLRIAHPLTTIDSESNEVRFAAISKLITQWQPALLVVGLPTTEDGEEHMLAPLCNRFARRLNGRYNLPVKLVNERYSSVEASRALDQQAIYGRKQKPMLDAVAAQQILQFYFDNPT